VEYPDVKIVAVTARCFLPWIAGVVVSRSVDLLLRLLLQGSYYCVLRIRHDEAFLRHVLFSANKPNRGF